MPDAAFSVQRLAQIYDVLDGPRVDLDAYEAIVGELGATTVIDVGCGTGSFAVRLAGRGIRVVGIDPAEASLDVARIKRGAERVRWVLGTLTSWLPTISVTTVPDRGTHATETDGGEQAAVDLVTMTGNTAQVFVDDADWHGTLTAAHEVLRPGGHLVFEVRDPEARAWETWTPEQSRSTVDTVHGHVESWVELTEVDQPLVSFRWTFRFLADDVTLTSDSTLRFRSSQEVTESLHRAGFVVEEFRAAPDRPGLELVVIARRNAPAGE